MSNYRVRQAFTLTRDGAEKPAGWDLLDGAEWCQRFHTKREATAAMRQLQAEECMEALGPAASNLNA